MINPGKAGLGCGMAKAFRLLDVSFSPCPKLKWWKRCQRLLEPTAFASTWEGVAKIFQLPNVSLSFYRKPRLWRRCQSLPEPIVFARVWEGAWEFYACHGNEFLRVALPPDLARRLLTSEVHHTTITATDMRSKE